MKGLIMALVAGAALLGGYHYLAMEREQAWQEGYDSAQAEGDKAIEALKRKHTEALLMQAKAAEVERRRQEAKARDQEAAYLSQRTELQRRIDELEDALDEAYIDHYRPEPGAKPEPVPGCVFTVGWLRDYNAALGGVRATAARAGQPDAEPWPTPGADAEFTSGNVSQRELLRHAQRYGQWCQANTHQLKALIDVVSQEETQP